MKKTIFISVFIFALGFISCINDIDDQGRDAFNQANAKDWFHSTFKKSAEWLQSTEKNNKLPDWNNGKYRKIGNLEILEFPLIENKTTITVPVENYTTSQEIKRVLDGTQLRIAFIKIATGKIVVRELYYVPEMDYLKSKDYDISDVTLGKINNDFTGLLITKKWNDEILGFRKIVDGNIKGVMVKSDLYANKSITDKNVNLGNYAKSAGDWDLGWLESVSVSGGGGISWYSWDVLDSYVGGWGTGGGGGAGGGYADYSPYDLSSSGGDTGTTTESTSPPSCESFNFVQTGSNWQESAVKNIRFVIVVYDPPLGAYINQIIEFPQPILFGSPINLLVGNTNIPSGAAAETGAEVLRISMQETVNMYGNKTVDELTVRLYFESKLKDNYSLMVPGGRVNINATNYSVTPTEYKSTWFGTANCN